MANTRINIMVGKRHDALRQHLSGFPDSASERLKMLASIGLTCKFLRLPSNVPQKGKTLGNLRVNPRLTDAYPELERELLGSRVRARRMADLAALGLHVLQNPDALISSAPADVDTTNGNSPKGTNRSRKRSRIAFSAFFLTGARFTPD